MPTLDELRLLAKIAHLYYERGLTQSQVGEQTHLSQATVSRLLRRAQREHIVHITVSQPAGVHPGLEEAIQERYDLKEVIVADCPHEDDDEIIRAIGAAGAFYLMTTAVTGEVVGISSWSETLLAVVDSMQPLRSSIHARVVQILGGIGNPGADSHATNLTRSLAACLLGKAVFLPAPGVLAPGLSRDAFYNDQFVREAIQQFDEVTLALVGIGAVEPSRILARSGNVFSPDELESLREVGAVGDLCLRFYEANGTPVITPLDARVIGMNLYQLGRVKRSVGIAGGHRKVEAIRGAIKGGWINVLITDQFTAEKLTG